MTKGWIHCHFEKRIELELNTLAMTLDYSQQVNIMTCTNALSYVFLDVISTG